MYAQEKPKYMPFLALKGALRGGALRGTLGLISRGFRGNFRRYVGESYHEHVGILYHQNLHVKQSIGVHSTIATNTAVSAVA